jgi:hypothetical protein
MIGREGHPSGAGGACFLVSRCSANPPMALLLGGSFVIGFGFLKGKVYNFLKDNEYDK